MGFDPITLGIAGGVLGAVTSAASASSNNDALSQQGANASSSAAINAEQLVEARKLERIKKQNEREQLVGRIRVASAENGTGSGGSQAALERQALINEEISSQISDKNLSSQLRALSIGLQSQLVSLDSNMQSPLLTGIAGGLAGMTTGLQIGNTIDAAKSVPQPKKAMPQQRAADITKTVGVPENYL